MSKVKAALGVVAVVAAMVVGIVAYRAVGGFFEPKAELTNTVVSRQLETMQDLTTAREKDYGFEEFSEGNIAHVNQKKFTMFYSYEIRAGVDLSKAKIAVDNDNHVISITLPKADLQSVSVDPDSLRFFVMNKLRCLMMLKCQILQRLCKMPRRQRPIKLLRVIF